MYEYTEWFSLPRALIESIATWSFVHAGKDPRGLWMSWQWYVTEWR
jgi:hypothetical protein